MNKLQNDNLPKDKIRLSKFKKLVLVFVVIFVIISGIGSIISISKFNTFNPYAAALGLAQVMYANKEYVEVQKTSRVIIAKPEASIVDYMAKKEFIESIDEQMGSMHTFRNGEKKEVVFVHKNSYFSKWIWN